jgi:hypothetical protein
MFGAEYGLRPPALELRVQRLCETQVPPHG